MFWAYLYTNYQLEKADLLYIILESYKVLCPTCRCWRFSDFSNRMFNF